MNQTGSHAAQPGADWAERAAAAYAEQAKPPLTPELVARVTAVLRDAGLGSVEPDSGAVERANAALDAFEVSLEAVAGPRLAALDAAEGEVRMAQRSEAGRPLRSFGGQ